MVMAYPTEGHTTYRLSHHSDANSYFHLAVTLAKNQNVWIRSRYSYILEAVSAWFCVGGRRPTCLLYGTYREMGSEPQTRSCGSYFLSLHDLPMHRGGKHYPVSLTNFYTWKDNCRHNLHYKQSKTEPSAHKTLTVH